MLPPHHQHLSSGQQVMVNTLRKLKQKELLGGVRDVPGLCLLSLIPELQPLSCQRSSQTHMAHSLNSHPNAPHSLKLTGCWQHFNFTALCIVDVFGRYNSSLWRCFLP